MGLGGFFKGLGKVALKVAPFALQAIPGIGTAAGIALGAGLGAADGAASGKGLKGALMGAGMGAGAAAGGAALKGLGAAKDGAQASNAALSNAITRTPLSTAGGVLPASTLNVAALQMGAKAAAGMNPSTLNTIIGAGAPLLGGLLGGIDQGKQNDKTMALQREQMAMQQQQLDLQRAQSVPQQQNWRQAQALMAAILPGLQNAQVQAPAGYQQYMPQISGGFKIPEGGFGADTQAFFSPGARQAAEQDLQNAGYQAPAAIPGAPKGTPAFRATPNQTSFGQVGYGSGSQSFGVGQVRPFVAPETQNAMMLQAFRKRAV